MSAIVTPSSHVASYNGVTFNVFCKSKVTSRAVRDDANRSVRFMEITLEIEGLVSLDDSAGSPPTIQTEVGNMRTALMQPGGALEYVGRGFEFSAGQNGAWDSAWGPHPEILSFTPLGGESRAALVNWRCTVRLPDLFNTAKFQGVPCAWNYTVSWDIDQDGYTTQTVNGYLEVPITRPAAGSRVVQDSADNYREQVRVQTPRGFQRAKQTFNLSADRRRLEFHIEDAEIVTPLPDGCSRFDARHRVRWRASNMVRTAGTISATITLQAGQPRALAYDKFLLLVRSRLLLPGQQLTPTLANYRYKPINGIGNPDAQSLLVTGLDVDEDVFGRSSSFNFDYELIGCKLQDLVHAHGLWRSVDNTNYSKWATSLAPIWGVRSNAGTRFSTNSDVLVDLGVATSPPTVTTGGKEPAPSLGLPQYAATLPLVDPLLSWVFFEQSCELLENDRVVSHKPLTGTVAVTPQGMQADGTALGAIASLGPPTVAVRSLTPDLVQRVSTPRTSSGFGAELHGCSIASPCRSWSAWAECPSRSLAAG